MISSPAYRGLVMLTFTAGFKYKGFSDMRGGGHFSGRLTWGIVAAGYFARKILSPANNISHPGGSRRGEGYHVGRTEPMETNDTVRRSGGVRGEKCSERHRGTISFMSVEAALGMIAFGIRERGGVWGGIRLIVEKLWFTPQ